MAVEEFGNGWMFMNPEHKKSYLCFNIIKTTNLIYVCPRNFSFLHQLHSFTVNSHTNIGFLMVYKSQTIGIQLAKVWEQSSTRLERTWIVSWTSAQNFLHIVTIYDISSFFIAFLRNSSQWFWSYWHININIKHVITLGIQGDMAGTIGHPVVVENVHTGYIFLCPITVVMRVVIDSRYSHIITCAHHVWS